MMTNRRKKRRLRLRHRVDPRIKPFLDDMAQILADAVVNDIRKPRRPVFKLKER
jgi:hypothetical protein